MLWNGLLISSRQRTEYEPLNLRVNRFVIKALLYEGLFIVLYLLPCLLVPFFTFKLPPLLFPFCLVF